MDKLLQLDTNWLLWINGHQADWLNGPMWYVSQASTWLPLYAWLIFMLYRMYGPDSNTKERKKQYWILFALAISMVAISAGLSDYITSGLLKKSICRLRPTQDPAIAPFVHLINGYTGGKYGFPSSHAANCWAVVVSFLSIQHASSTLPHTAIAPTIKWVNIAVLLTYAILNCYSRMYLGVHYPLDILCGGLIGILIAVIMGIGFNHVRMKILPD